jgi:hypothetical protein
MDFDERDPVSRITDIIQCYGVDPVKSMKSIIGQIIWTFHTGRVLEYRIVGLTSLPLRSLKVGEDSMMDYYRNKYDIRLDFEDLPCFYCECSNVIPPELAFFDK